MKKVRENISMFELTKITSQQDIFLQALGKTSIVNTTSLDKGSSKSPPTLESILNALTMDARHTLPTFLINFQNLQFKCTQLLG